MGGTASIYFVIRPVGTCRAAGFHKQTIMRKLFLYLFVSLAFLSAGAQNRKTAARRQPASAKVNKKQPAKRQPAARGRAAKSKTPARQPTVTNASIRGLKNQSAQIKKNIREQEQRLRTNERDVKQRLQNLMVINTEIDDKRKTIDTIRHDIHRLNGNIGQLNGQLRNLQAELEERKQRYVKSMRYMHHNNSIQNQLMFIFSAKNFTQMFRRMRFMREYANYQRAQGEMVKVKQGEVTRKHMQLTAVKQQKHTLLNKGERERRNLEGKQVEQQQVVTSLQKQQKTIQSIIAQQRKKNEAINAQIDRLVAIEVEKARQRAIAEAKRKAEVQRKAAEEARRRKAAELARKKAEAEAAARENARRIAEAKAREEQAKAAARAAARKDAEERAAAERAAREAENVRRAAERKAAAEAREHEREVAEARKEQQQAAQVPTMDTEDRRISGSFESNRGRLPMPITGGYRIVSHFGQYNVEGLSNVRLDNKGINILGGAGAKARSIYDGEVSAVFSLGGTTGVMVRHGSYISVYCNLSSVSVHRGQHVSARQVLGTVGQDNILQFQLRREKAKLNPEAWLGR